MDLNTIKGTSRRAMQYMADSLRIMDGRPDRISRSTQLFYKFYFDTIKNMIVVVGLYVVAVQSPGPLTKILYLSSYGVFNLAVINTINNYFYIPFISADKHRNPLVMIFVALLIFGSANWIVQKAGSLVIEKLVDIQLANTHK